MLLTNLEFWHEASCFEVQGLFWKRYWQGFGFFQLVYTEKLVARTNLDFFQKLKDPKVWTWKKDQWLWSSTQHVIVRTTSQVLRFKSWKPPQENRCHPGNSHLQKILGSSTIGWNVDLVFSCQVCGHFFGGVDGGFILWADGLKQRIAGSRAFIWSSRSWWIWVGDPAILCRGSTFSDVFKNKKRRWILEL